MDANFATTPEVTLSSGTAADLEQHGFVVVPNFIPSDTIESFVRAYDHAVAAADPTDIHIGRASTRVNDFVNRGPPFEDLCFVPLLQDAAALVIGLQFRLSSFHARTLHPGAENQELHVDVSRHSADWPLLGAIIMVDGFTPENGATRFVPGSHRWPESPVAGTIPPHGSVLACGPAGSVVLFNGSTWHGYSSNRTTRPRRSLQAACIPRGGHAATPFLSRMPAATRARLSPAALRVLGD